MTRKRATQQLTKEEKDFLQALLARPTPEPEPDIGEFTLSGDSHENDLLGQLMGSKTVQLHAQHGGLTLISDLRLRQNELTQKVSVQLQSPSIVDNNGTPRKLRICPGKCDISLEDGQHHLANAELIDISASGASIATTAPLALEVGTVLSPLQIRIKDRGVVTLAGEVVRVVRQPRSNRTTIGLQFFGYSADSQRAIVEYVYQRHLEASASDASNVEKTIPKNSQTTTSDD